MTGEWYIIVLPTLCSFLSCFGQRTENRAHKINAFVWVGWAINVLAQRTSKYVLDAFDATLLTLVTTSMYVLDPTLLIVVTVRAWGYVLILVETSKYVLDGKVLISLTTSKYVLEATLLSSIQKQPAGPETVLVKTQFSTKLSLALWRQAFLFYFQTIKKWIPKSRCFRVSPQWQRQLIFIGWFWFMTKASFFLSDALQSFYVVVLFSASWHGGWCTSIAKTCSTEASRGFERTNCWECMFLIVAMLHQWCPYYKC